MRQKSCKTARLKDSWASSQVTLLTCSIYKHMKRAATPLFK